MIAVYLAMLETDVDRDKFMKLVRMRVIGWQMDTTVML